jgi:hypothetical protein
MDKKKTDPKKKLDQDSEKESMSPMRRIPSKLPMQKELSIKRPSLDRQDEFVVSTETWHNIP